VGHPEVIKNLFFHRKNEAGIYALRMYVRGKPWTVVVDDYLYINYNNDNLRFMRAPADGSMWSILLEKAWAKISGDYNRSEYGANSIGLMAVSGTYT